MNVSLKIRKYLDGHRRLVVPEFGAFVVKESGEVVFTELLSADDGVLRELVMAEGYGEMEAAAIIDRFVFEMRHELDDFGYVKLEGLGTLRRDVQSGALRFVVPVAASTPDVTVRQVVSPIAATPVQQPATQSEISVPQEPVVRRAKRGSHRTDKFMIFALVVVVLALAAIAYGWYCSQSSDEMDDAMMDSLRIEVAAPEQR
jgi:hypothetical protein